MSDLIDIQERAAIFTVSDLKQFAYCPRVVYYTYCLPLLRPETAKMRESVMAHEEESRREKRRSLKLYGVPEGERLFDVVLATEELGLRGRADLVIRRDDQVIPVDYKLTRRQAGAHFRLQLAAYGLMLSEMWALPARRGFVYSIITREAEEIALTPALYGRIRRMARAIRRMVEDEIMPSPPERRARCVACEFRRFCNDF